MFIKDKKILIIGTPIHNYTQIINGVRGKDLSSPLWRRLLDAYGVQLILTNAIDTNGYLLPLVDSLSQTPEWQLVYQDGNALLFLRSTDINRFTFQRFFLPKREKLLDQIVLECQKGIKLTPATWGYYETLGNVYLIRYEFDKAKDMFRRYLKMNPYNKKVIESLKMLESLPQNTSTLLK